MQAPTQQPPTRQEFEAAMQRVLQKPDLPAGLSRDQVFDLVTAEIESGRRKPVEQPSTSGFIANAGMGLGNLAMDTAGAVHGIATDPVGTLKSIPAGIVQRVKDFTGDMHPGAAWDQLKEGNVMSAVGNLLPVGEIYRDPTAAAADIAGVGIGAKSVMKGVGKIDAMRTANTTERMLENYTPQFKGGYAPKSKFFPEFERVDPHMPNKSGSADTSMPRNLNEPLFAQGDKPTGPAPGEVVSPAPSSGIDSLTPNKSGFDPDAAIPEAPGQVPDDLRSLFTAQVVDDLPEGKVDTPEAPPVVNVPGDSGPGKWDVDEGGQPFHVVDESAPGPTSSDLSFTEKTQDLQRRLEKGELTPEQFDAELEKVTPVSGPDRYEASNDAMGKFDAAKSGVEGPLDPVMREQMLQEAYESSGFRPTPFETVDATTSGLGAIDRGDFLTEPYSPGPNTRGTQRFVFGPQVESVKDSMRRGTLETFGRDEARNLPIVTTKGGIDEIAEGHHRLTASSETGIPTKTARTYSDPMEMPFPHKQTYGPEFAWEKGRGHFFESDEARAAASPEERASASSLHRDMADMDSRYKYWLDNEKGSVSSYLFNVLLGEMIRPGLREMAGGRSGILGKTKAAVDLTGRAAKTGAKGGLAVHFASEDPERKYPWDQ